MKKDIHTLQRAWRGKIMFTWLIFVALPVNFCHTCVDFFLIPFKIVRSIWEAFLHSKLSFYISHDHVVSAYIRNLFQGTSFHTRVLRPRTQACVLVSFAQRISSVRLVKHWAPIRRCGCHDSLCHFCQWFSWSGFSDVAHLLLSFSREKWAVNSTSYRSHVVKRIQYSRECKLLCFSFNDFFFLRSFSPCSISALLDNRLAF